MHRERKRSEDPELPVKSWDRQPHESSNAFSAFILYRNAAGARTYQQVAEMLHCSGANVRRYLQDFARFAYLVGWRKGEIASLHWSDVDNDIIRLRPEHSKNGIGRSAPLHDSNFKITEVGEVIERRRSERTFKAKSGPQLSAYVFHRKGSAIGDLRKAWATACAAAGLDGMLFQDLRRTAVRNMVRAGVSEHMAMQISGHRTRSIFDRYNIVNERDKQDALRRTQDYLGSASKKRRVAVTTPHS